MPEALDACHKVPAKQLAARVDLIIAIRGGWHDARCIPRSGPARRTPAGSQPGRLGFLNDISPDNLTTAIETLLQGDYVTESRLMLEARIFGGKADRAPSSP